MTLDIESVLAGHEDWDHWGGENRCLCGAVLTVPDFALSEQIAAAHRAHVAAVLREQIAAWLGSEAVERGIVQQANAEDDRHFAAGSSHGLGAGEAVSLTLDALAAQVACVDPSRSEGGSTDPEVRQSSDRTSAPSRVPGEGS